MIGVQQLSRLVLCQYWLRFCFLIPRNALIFSVGFLLLLAGPLRKFADGITWGLKTIYRPIIQFTVKNVFTKLIVVALAAAILIASIPFTPFYKNIGQEFMPPLNEGDLLFMPVLLPGASITQAKDVMAKQDMIMNNFPEVAMVVGKLGRAATATDPAPIGMFETIISITDPSTWPRRTVKEDATTLLVQDIAVRLMSTKILGDIHTEHINGEVNYTHRG